MFAGRFQASGRSVQIESQRNNFASLYDEELTPSILSIAPSFHELLKTRGFPSVFSAREISPWLAAGRKHTTDTRGEGEVEVVWSNKTSTCFVPHIAKILDDRKITP